MQRGRDLQVEVHAEHRRDVQGPHCVAELPEAPASLKHFIAFHPECICSPDGRRPAKEVPLFSVFLPFLSFLFV